MIDPAALEFAGERLAIEPMAAAGADEPSAGLGFLGAEQPAANASLFGGIEELQDQAIMFLGEEFQRGNSERVVQVAEDDHQGAGLEKGGELGEFAADVGLFVEAIEPEAMEPEEEAAA
jgi:hypothetical protein